MKIQIRAGTFETNSSSAHSFVVTKGVQNSIYTKEEILRELDTNREGSYELSVFDDELTFGRYPFDILDTFEKKLRYAYACAPLRKRIGKNGNTTYSREFYKITRVVKQLVPEYTGLHYYGIGRCYAGTDEDMLFGWLKKLNISLLDFLIDRRYIIIVDGDEYCVWHRLKKANLIDSRIIKMEL